MREGQFGTTQGETGSTDSQQIRIKSYLFVYLLGRHKMAWDNLGLWLICVTTIELEQDCRRRRPIDGLN